MFEAVATLPVNQKSLIVCNSELNPVHSSQVFMFASHIL